MNHTVKYFLVTIAQRKGYVSVIEYPEKKFIIRFINDKFSDFINSFKTLGFGVELIISDSELFHVSEDLSEEEAKKIWNQVKNRLDHPDHSVIIGGFNNVEE